MEAQLVVLLMFVFVVLTANALVIWFAYKAFASVASTIVQNISEIQTSGVTRDWLSALESASDQAVRVTGTAKEKVFAFEPVLARAQSMFGFGLAKVDVKLERLCDNISYQAERVQQAVTRPAEKIGAAVSGVQTVLEFSDLLSLGRTGLDAISMPKR